MNAHRIIVTLAVLATAQFGHPALAQVPSMLNYQGRVSVNGTNFHGTGLFKFALVDGGSDQSRQATAGALTLSGTILFINVLNGGAGYVTPPTVTIFDGAGMGSGATATAQISGGAVISITVNNGGNNYVSPVVHVSPPPPDIQIATYWSNDGTSVNGAEPTTAVSLPVYRGLYSVALGDASLANMIPLPPAAVNHPEIYLRVWFSDGVSGFQSFSPDQRLAAVAYALQAASVPDGSITGAQLAPGAVADNLGATGQAAVPQGALVLSDSPSNPAFTAAGYVNIGTVQTGNTWEERNVMVPPETRDGYSMIWTGSELIVWGGATSGIPMNVGRRYNPSNNFWSALSTANAPSARRTHTAVWTGTEMIVWGGQIVTPSLSVDYVNKGARYNPANNTWTPMSTNNAPSARHLHTAIWTGTEMIVWGGQFGSVFLETGARYNPDSNTWSPISLTNVPTARSGHSAIWTGSEMIIWGGSGVSLQNSGGRYNPANNTWTSTTTSGAPTARLSHSAIWSGSEMIIWGGIGSSSTYFSSGGRYNPANNSWLSGGTATIGAPSQRRQHFAVWTGDRMVVWGGENTNPLNTGGVYTPAADSWSPMQQEGAPGPSFTHTALWAGDRMLVWGAPGNNPRVWTYRPGQVMYLFQGL